jgi:hypothetical protein
MTSPNDNLTDAEIREWATGPGSAYERIITNPPAPLPTDLTGVYMLLAELRREIEVLKATKADKKRGVPFITK